MSEDPTASTLFPDIAKIQEYWQSALRNSTAQTKDPSAAFGDLQAASAKWISHRQDDLGKAIEAFKQISTCRNPADAIALQQKWFAESLQSLMSDWMELMNPAAATTQRELTPPAEAPIYVKKARQKTTD